MFKQHWMTRGTSHASYIWLHPFTIAPHMLNSLCGSFHLLDWTLHGWSPFSSRADLLLCLCSKLGTKVGLGVTRMVHKVWMKSSLAVCLCMVQHWLQNLLYSVLLQFKFVKVNCSHIAIIVNSTQYIICLAYSISSCRYIYELCWVGILYNIYILCI